MLRRYIEVCPKCGQWMPWKKTSTHIVHGQKRQYVKCFRCGKRDVIIYLPPKNNPIDGLLQPNNWHRNG